MNRKKLLQRLSEGAVQNVSFADMVHLAEGFGFALARTSGSHHIFIHSQVRELVNLQEGRIGRSTGTPPESTTQ